MPWRESTVMEERLRFVARRLEGEPMTALCREFGISRKTGHKLFARWKAHGLEALGRPAAPARAGREPAADAGRGDDRGAPAREADLGGAQAPRAAGAPARGGRAGAGALDDPRGARPPRPGRACACPSPAGDGHAAVGARRPERSLVRRLQGRVPARQRPALLSADRHRPGLALHPDGRGAGGDGEAPVFTAFHRLFQERGLPAAIRSDNGVPFASRGLYGLSRLSVWWLRLGIALERIAPGRPQQNGRHERMHLTLKQETSRPGRRQQPRPAGPLRRLRREFNTERPHEALAMKTPAAVYTASPRPFAGLPELAYPFHDRDVVVARNGTIGLHGRPVIISTVFEGQRLGLREVDTDVWLVSFMHYDLGYIDLEARTLQTIDTPFGSRVSPM